MIDEFTSDAEVLVDATLLLMFDYGKRRGPEQRGSSISSSSGEFYIVNVCEKWINILYQFSIEVTAEHDASATCFDSTWYVFRVRLSSCNGWNIELLLFWGHVL